MMCGDCERCVAAENMVRRIDSGECEHGLCVLCSGKGGRWGEEAAKTM